MKGGVHPSLLAALSFRNLKKVDLSIYCWVDRVFQSSHGEAQPRTHRLYGDFLHHNLIRAFSDFKAFLYILFGGFS